jgi:6-phosphogluconolactonase
MTDPIPLQREAEIQAPALPGSVVVRRTSDELLDAMSADMVAHALQCVRTLGDFHVALSGGSTPLPFYRHLMVDPGSRLLPWKRTHLWIVDERCVGFEDERSNFRAIDELIGTQSDIPRGQVHPMEATREDADERYERELAETLLWRERGHDRLDYVLLGMGADAHTASLFPRSAALRRSLDEDGAGSNGRMVVFNRGPGVTPPDRVTMTLRCLNASRFVAVLVTGASKRETIERVSSAYRAHADGLPRDVVEAMPILGVRPRAGELRWYLDSAACPGA